MKYIIKVEFEVDTVEFFFGNGRGVQQEDVKELVEDMLTGVEGFPTEILEGSPIKSIEPV